MLDAATPAAAALAVERAAALINSGELVAMPTETVYGLAADATDDRAVARIYEAKGRPSFNPLIVHVADLKMARRYVDFSPLAEKIAAEFWPGPLTLVLPRKGDAGLSLLASAGLETLAVRAPASPLAQALIRISGKPLAAPSANRSGSISPTRADHVRDSLGDRVGLILDGGPSAVGVESTIVKVDGDRAILLRPGGVAREAIERVTGRRLETPERLGVEAPGMLESHYAPKARLKLNVAKPGADEAYIAFGKHDGAPARVVYNLSDRGDLVEAAANLFAHLHAADRMASALGLYAIAVAPVPNEGLGEAINDRLKRAAAPRGNDGKTGRQDSA
ncbi:MAG: threonylcarbamoyl-AMP synthase [Alphaproteobacteria bacterium RIFCSPHIGHO2_12_FULL_63_12]|nr:MAG: threonylcarbamoyl-AMP synthase [Alphaproteobacteria bacterium RIFCSPHIGHO2_12_FULL_63_12]